jgi:NAD dependent epimerase/dehydratase family enzyme
VRVTRSNSGDGVEGLCAPAKIGNVQSAMAARMERAGIVILPNFLAAVLMSTAAHALALLSARRERPRSRRAAEKRG